MKLNRRKTAAPERDTFNRHVVQLLRASFVRLKSSSYVLSTKKAEFSV